MKKMTSEMATRCELALMGKVVPVNSNDEVNEMTKYILRAIGKEYDEENFDILKNAIHRYSKTNKVTHLVTNTLMGCMQCITYCIDTGDEDMPKPFEEDYGTGYPCSFCYVFNTTEDFCSEFGDCFFEKKADGYYHRKS